MLRTQISTADFDYSLPQHLIAQYPSARREDSRLLVLQRETGSLIHTSFSSITDYLRPGDVLVANRSRVIPARIHARKATGGAVELLLVRRTGPASWTAMARPSRKLADGVVLLVPDSDLSVEVHGRREDDTWNVEFIGEGDIESKVFAAGHIPFPPYIRADPRLDHRYQTVFADRDGSVAAPTAGLHFSDELLARLNSSGVRLVLLTLHVGPGTFKPVTVDRPDEHHMHPEWGELNEDAADTINRARASGRRVIAVGTTSTRMLESSWVDGVVRPFRGETSLFIYPGYRFWAIDGLVTNFHLPRSTLLMLVSAFAGREAVLHAYDEAIRMEYRFYSFGDAMLIL